MFDFKSLIQTLFAPRDTGPNVRDLRSATEMLGELPESDRLMAQVEIIKALQQLNQNLRINTKERCRTIPYLDEKARKLQDQLIGIYHGTIIDEHAPRAQLLLTITAFWKEMGTAYQLCLKQALHASSKSTDNLLPLFTLRAMRYYCEHTKWAYLRYMPLDDKTWRRINRLYFFADQQGFADGMLAPYADSPHSSIRREYMKILMLTLAAPEKMQPDQVELVAHWLEKWVGRIDLEEIIRPHRQLFAINIAGSSPPQRLRRDMVGANWRYWFTDTLVQHLKETLVRLQQGAAASDVGLPARTSLPANLELMQRLGDLWSRDKPAPARRHDRQTSNKNIRVLRGLDAIIAHLAKHAPHSGSVNISNELTQALAADQARWTVENESLRGIGVQFRHARDDKLQTGEIVGMLPEETDSPLSIGIVRRLTKQSDGQMNAGIETITVSPLVVDIRAKPENPSCRAIFSPEDSSTRQGRLLLVPQAYFGENLDCTLAAQGKTYRIRLSKAQEHTTDAILAGFSVLAKGHA
ncbi:MAG: hypothetical protein H6R07_1956 [Proteobacteria bacterium]|nr:hypothetical protein [Pseudomonadota bacterium]